MPTRFIIKENYSQQIINYIYQDGYTNILLVYGKQSIKQNGLYDQVIEKIHQLNIQYHEINNIHPNPSLDKVVEGIQLVKQFNIQAVLAIGGASSIDTAKGIACCLSLDQNEPIQNVWQFYERKRKLTKTLPVYTILTLSAAGSEMNNSSVITNDQIQQKFSVCDNLLIPKVSITDPLIQNQLPIEQTINGSLDGIVHIFEFLTNIDDLNSTITTTNINISLIKSIITLTDRIIINNNVTDRKNLIWAISCGLNSISEIFMNGGDWVCHNLEHSLGARYPQIIHARGLAIIMPHLIKSEAKRGKRIQQYKYIAKELFNQESIEALISGFVNLCKKWKFSMSLNEIMQQEINQQERQLIAELYMKRNISGYNKDGITFEQANEIYQQI